MGKFGLRPAESLLSKRIVVVEGPTDVTLIRELVELHSGGHQTIMICWSFLQEEKSRFRSLVCCWKNLVRRG